MSVQIDGTNGVTFNDGTSLSTTPVNPVKAWVRFTGSTGAIQASSGNISVTRNSTGYYTLTLSSALADANYAVNATSSSGSIACVAAAFCSNYATGTTPTTTSFTVAVFNPYNGTQVDSPNVSVTVLR